MDLAFDTYQMDSKNKDLAFMAMIKSHKGLIYKVSNAYAITAEDREDLAQEIIYNIWKSFDRYDATYKVSTWIYRIALNVSISNLRKSAKKQHQESTNIEFLSYEPETSNENLELLQKFIRELKEIDKAIILLHLDELSHADISEMLGISISNVSTRIHRIKHFLTKKFKQ